jgi:hypothetical protein
MPAVKLSIVVRIHVGGIECQHVAVSGIDAVCNAVICGVETRLLLQNAGLADVVIATV